jgi:hypothetical protein
MSAPAPVERCYLCGEAAPAWKITAEKKGEPMILVVYFACEKCKPFEYVLKKSPSPVPQ